jgi:cell division protein FtsB
MIEFTQKKKARKFMYSLPVLIFLFAALSFLASKAFVLYQKESEVRKKSEEVRIDLAKLETRKNELEKKLEFLKTERGREEEMRSRFMLGKEGEGVILVVDQKPTTTVVRETAKTSGWWSGFLNFFR